MKTMKILSILIACVMTLKASAQVKADDIVGLWLIDGDKPAKISIFKNGDKYNGKIAWLKFPEPNGKPLVDAKNPDASKQSQPILGLEILKGFHFDKDEWVDGQVYDPLSGKTYSCILSLKDPNTLKVRGYIGMSLFGRTQIWTRTH